MRNWPTFTTNRSKTSWNQMMDLDWLRRLDIHLGAYERTGELLPLADLRAEIDMAKFACGIGPDPRLVTTASSEERGRDA